MTCGYITSDRYNTYFRSSIRHTSGSVLTKYHVYHCGVTDEVTWKYRGAHVGRTEHQGVTVDVTLLRGEVIVYGSAYL